jgi:hypothetical protein
MAAPFPLRASQFSTNGLFSPMAVVSNDAPNSVVFVFIELTVKQLARGAGHVFAGGI